jgi:Calcineurin-like phosphoesterase
MPLLLREKELIIHEDVVPVGGGTMLETANKSDKTIPPSPEDLERSRKKIIELRKGRLPQMVDWFDPSVLGTVAVRNLISATIGDYADQRPMQAATDEVGDAALASRHDYSKVIPGNEGVQLVDGRWCVSDGATTKSLSFDEDNALWVDFIADLGDGFEATYAMAYLLAQPAIPVDIKDANGKRTNLPLPAGEILILGGDLAYPNATVTEYNDRCIDPYDAAFQLKDGETPKRKLFFIAGNHDWYDGLGAFTSVFCAARDRFAHGKGKKIGGWQCEQRRSYFALALPHGWWFWGVDLALNETVDDAQKNYFELMSEQTGPGDKIIIILHAPVWQTNANSPLHAISQWARNKGAEVVAVLAGDLHFYSRYRSQSKDLDLQLITSGGGGAFAHPTHQLSRTMKVHWTLPKRPEQLPHAGTGDYRDTVITATAADPPVAAFHLPSPHDFHAPHIYPSRTRSTLLAFRNLWLPLHNRRFAIFLGLIYMIFAWVFQTATADPTDAIKRSQTVTSEQECIVFHPQQGADRAKCISDKKAAIDRTSVSKAPAAAVGDATAGAINAPEKANGPTMDAKWFEAWLQSARQGGWLNLGKDLVVATIAPTRVLYAMLANPAFFFMIVGLFVGLIAYVDANFRFRWMNWPVKLALGVPHASAHLTILLATNAAFSPVLNFALSHGDQGGLAGFFWIVGGVALYSLLMIMIGGFLGGLLFGFYWVLTSVVGRMHMDAFSALGIAGYKNFLRMRIEADKLTIFPIGLDTVPGRKDWRPLRQSDDTSGHNPLIKPMQPLRPHLIEQPIVIVSPAAKAMGITAQCDGGDSIPISARARFQQSTQYVG